MMSTIVRRIGRVLGCIAAVIVLVPVSLLVLVQIAIMFPALHAGHWLVEYLARDVDDEEESNARDSEKQEA